MFYAGIYKAVNFYGFQGFDMLNYDALVIDCNGSFLTFLVVLGLLDGDFFGYLVIHCIGSIYVVLC